MMSREQAAIEWAAIRNPTQYTKEKWHGIVQREIAAFKRKYGIKDTYPRDTYNLRQSFKSEWTQKHGIGSPLEELEELLIWAVETPPRAPKIEHYVLEIQESVDNYYLHCPYDGTWLAISQTGRGLGAFRWHSDRSWMTAMTKRGRTGIDEDLKEFAKRHKQLKFDELMRDWKYDMDRFNEFMSRRAFGNEIKTVGMV